MQHEFFRTILQRNSKVLWIVSGLFLPTMLHCTIYRELPLWIAYHVIVFGRVFASLSVSWFIVASACGEKSK